MCGFIAQLVEHRTGIAEVTGSNPVEALIFSGFFFPIASIGKHTAMIILHFHYQTVLVKGNQINSNAEKRGNIDLTEASSSERKR